MRLTIGGLVVVARAAGCHGHTHLEGRVLGPRGKPVAGAKVRLALAEDPERVSEMTTEKDGRFFAALTHAPSNVALVLTVTKQGFKTYREEFTARQAREVASMKVVLEREP
jgi:hypothetical protein